MKSIITACLAFIGFAGLAQTTAEIKARNDEHQISKEARNSNEEIKKSPDSL